ncbi:MAG TPA: hypothetical protein VE152_06825 [Acidimicrobiales bacterium]|nr:hypothetical protein [Acidimicrobiales bacterium]
MVVRIAKGGHAAILWLLACRQFSEVATLSPLLVVTGTAADAWSSVLARLVVQTVAAGTERAVRGLTLGAGLG